MRASEAIRSLAMRPHEENGLYVEGPSSDGSPRGASGSICYYLGPKEFAAFHVIDCDEYWVHVEGAPLEIWVAADGELERIELGLGPGMAPIALIRAGRIFAARHRDGADDGTLVACVTVPRFDYAGWRLVPEDEVAAVCPAAAEFFRRGEG